MNRHAFAVLLFAVVASSPLLAQSSTGPLDGSTGVVDVNAATVTTSGVYVKSDSSTAPNVSVMLGATGTSSNFTILSPTTPVSTVFNMRADGRATIGSSGSPGAIDLYGPLNVYSSSLPSFVLDSATESRFQIKLNGVEKFLFNYGPNAANNGHEALLGCQSGAGPLHLATNSVPRITITEAGNVGIGTTTPNSNKALHVVGDIEVTGNINAKFQDVAEWVPSREDLAPGTVVVLSGERANEVIASGEPYDSRVAGVVSARPGLVLGEAAANHETIATFGRVRVRVDATAAPIRIGDLLVTSGKRGTAMRSEPITMQGRHFHQPGTIIGKALEPLQSGEGEILVLLSLQ